MKDQLINATYLLEIFPGKGGWTYATIPEIVQNKNNPFGWVKVKGSIDHYQLSQYKLMPMGNGKLFLPVKAQIRKEINKQAGDFVHIILYPDESSSVVPEEIIACFKNEQKQVYTNFQNLSEGERKSYVDWIYGAKKDETKVVRIAEMMRRLQHGMKLDDKW